MAPILDPKFCSRCGGPIAKAVPPQDHRPRHVCAACGFVHYLDPKVACGTIAEQEGRFALIQRGIEPKKGSWSFPCGFMEIDETTEQAAIRETLEETGLIVEPNEIVGLYSRLEAAIVVIAFEARIVGGEARETPEALQIQAFHPEAIPWDGIAFKTTAWALRDWIHRRHPELHPRLRETVEGA